MNDQLNDLVKQILETRDWHSLSNEQIANGLKELRRSVFSVEDHLLDHAADRLLSLPTPKQCKHCEGFGCLENDSTCEECKGTGYEQIRSNNW